MTGILQPLDNKFAIVDRHGNPTDYFIRWAQQKQIDIGSSITLTDLANYLAAHKLASGQGIALTPDGNLANSPSISVLNGIGLDFDVMHNLKLADTAVVPGTYGDATHVPAIVVDQQGRITGVTLVAISGGGGGSYTLLEQHTAANSATLDFTTGFSATYDDYEFEFIQLVPATSGSNPWMRFSTNGGTSYDASTIYDFSNNFWGSSNFNANNGAENQAQAVLHNAGVGNAAGLSASGNLKLFNPASPSMYKQFNFQFAGSASDGHFYNTLGAGRYKSATAVNAVRFMFSAGNITSGIIRLYGRAKV